MDQIPNRLPDDSYSSDRKNNMQIGSLLAHGEVFRRKWNWYDIHMPECLETKQPTILLEFWLAISKQEKETTAKAEKTSILWGKNRADKMISPLFLSYSL